MIVTALTALRRGRVGLHLDGEFYCSLHPEVACRLHPGQELVQAELEELEAGSNHLSAKARALVLLGIRAYTCQGLFEKLASDWGEEAAAAAVARMQELGYLDDEDYARRYARELARKGHAPARMLRELSQKGIDRQLAQSVLEEREDDPELAAAKIVRRKYLKDLQGEKGLRRAQNALARLGYRYDVIRAVLTHLQEDEGYYDEPQE